MIIIIIIIIINIDNDDDYDGCSNETEKMPMWCDMQNKSISNIWILKFTNMRENNYFETVHKMAFVFLE